MSELIQKNDNRATIRWKLLTGASALALTAYVSSAAVANAEDVSQPQIWIELGGQLEGQSGLGHTYTPSFIANNPDSPAFNPVSPLRYERPPLFSKGLEGAITFRPDDSDWQFSASIRYGRSTARRSANPGRDITRHAHGTYPFIFRYKSNPPPSAPAFPGYPSYVATPWPPRQFSETQIGHEFAPIQVTQKQTHEIIDFMAGKDVGLGLFSKNTSSTFSAGVRFAQFRSKTAAVMHARPDNEFGYFTNAYAHHYAPSYPFRFPTGPNFHTYAAQFHADREFEGVGPSISWNASVPIAGVTSDEALTVDWGINAALLFGRQRTRGEHQTSGHYRRSGANSYYTATGNPFDRSRRVTIPNVGGMLGMSLKFPNAKISIGYRGDFFFGAMDTGNDTRKTSTTGFFGPYASISIGLGD